jgi:hypothetical protein
MADFVAYARANKKNYLFTSFWHFLQVTQMCGGAEITPDPYETVADNLEGSLPDTPNIRAWREKNGRHRIPVSSDNDKRLFVMLLMSRKTRKTSFVKALLTFALEIDVDFRSLLCRATIKDAKNSLRGVCDAMEQNPTYVDVCGRPQSKYVEWTKEYITRGGRSVPFNEPTLDTSGLDSSKNGAHLDFVICDDLVHEKNFESADIMEDARTKILSMLPVMEDTATMLVIGTRWGDNDVYGWIIDEDEKRVMAGDTPMWHKIVWGAYNEQNKARFPKILPEGEIEAYRSRLTAKMFSSLILNECRAEGENIFTLAYIRYFDGEYAGGLLGNLRLLATPENKDLRSRFGESVSLRTIILVDPAPTVGPRSDETGIVVVGFDREANWWVLAAYGVKKLPSDRLQFITNLALKYRPELIAQENADMSAPLLQESLRKVGVQTRVVGFNPRQDRRKMLEDTALAPRGMNSKAAQMESLEPILKGGRVFINREETYKLVQQLLKYPYLIDNKDDVLDAFSMARAYESEMVFAAQQTVEEIEEAQERREYETEGLSIDEEACAYRNPGDTPETTPGRAAGLMGV